MPTCIFKVKLAHQKRTCREIEILGELKYPRVIKIAVEAAQQYG